MSAALRTAFLRALTVAVATLGDVATGINYSYRLLQYYRRHGGTRNVTPEAAAALVRYLRRRARELDRAAKRLEETLNRERRAT